MLKDLMTESALETAETYKVKPKTGDELYGIEPSSKKEYYPTLHLDASDLPEIKEWKTGEEYVIVLRVTQTGSSSRNEKMSADFDIKEIGVLGDDEDSDEDDKNEDDKNEDDSKEESSDVKDYMKANKLS